jgi:hypothetical protein
MLWAWRWSEGWTVYTEQARVAETASGVDGDDDERVETRRMTGTQPDVIQYNPIQFNVFVVTKYTTLYYFQMPSRDGL